MRFVLIACLVACAADQAPVVPPAAITSPGPLSQSHGAIDNQLGCNDCHVSGTPALDSEKCLACHAPIADRILQRAGVHGAARDRACSACHGEHKGRGFDLRGWQALPGGERGFDHDRAGWPLRSRHGVARCDQCHPRTNIQGLRVYLGTDRACIACHEQEEPHRTRLACERCHLDAGWRPVKRVLDLDHPPSLPLEGAHAKVACMKCHTDRTFLLPAGSCASCHVDPHAGDPFDRQELGCESCHAASAASFRVIAFDHQAATKQSLRMHRKLRCVECHAQPAAVTCAGCHAGVQPAGRAITRHGNRFGARACQDCHTLTGWRARVFDHHKTKFPLRWAHATLTCRECHRGSDPATFEDLGKQTSCKGCHAHANVHDNKYEEHHCLKCHHGY